MDRITKNSLVSNYKELFFKKFKSKPEIISIAPGRVNIIGEHTDYNSGLAMPVAIDRWIVSMVSLRSDAKVSVLSTNYDKSILFNLNDLKENTELWEKYIKSTIYVLNKKYSFKNGFNILVGGNVPIGFGMSSSAALEVSIISSILSIYSKNYDKYELLKICNEVESKVLGIKSGMLDQYASIFSKDKNFLIIDFSSMTHNYFKSNLRDSSWVLVNSMISRNLVNSEYNNRVKECNIGLDMINNIDKKNLSFNDLTLEHIEFLKINEKIYNRLLHVVSENKRVKKMKKEISVGNQVNVGKILLESHYSLSKKYQVSCSEIDSIINISKKHSGFYGGRIMGGGFGGCTINLIKSDLKNDFISFVKDKYYKKYAIRIKTEEVFFTSGLSVLTDL